LAKFPNFAQAVAGALYNVVQNGGAPDLEAPRRVVQQLGEWGSHLSQNAAAQWGASLLAGQDCSFEDCEQDALGLCIGCRDPVCLAHAMVSFRADLICDECVAKLVQPRARNRRSAAGSESPDRVAFRYFCVTPEASWSDIQAIYRRRMQEIHPDHGGSTESAQELNHHFGVLKRFFERAA
jgi:hypothetical protein